MSNKNNGEEKEPKNVAQITINFLDNGQTSITFPKNIPVEMLRLELQKYVFMFSDEIAVQKLLKIQSEKRILTPNGLPISPMKLTKM